MSVANRERVPLRPLEEGCPEGHELGDHRALLQFQWYAAVNFLPGKKNKNKNV